VHKLELKLKAFEQMHSEAQKRAAASAKDARTAEGQAKKHEKARARLLEKAEKEKERAAAGDDNEAKRRAINEALQVMLEAFWELCLLCAALAYPAICPSLRTCRQAELESIDAKTAELHVASGDSAKKSEALTRQLGAMARMERDHAAKLAQARKDLAEKTRSSKQAIAARRKTSLARSPSLFADGSGQGDREGGEQLGATTSRADDL